MRVHGEPHFLVVESFHSLLKYVKIHPVAGGLGLVILFLAVLGILKRIFGRIEGDIIVFAVIVWAIFLTFGSSLLTFFHVKGF